MLGFSNAKARLAVVVNRERLKKNRNRFITDEALNYHILSRLCYPYF
jgi:hypothetical protein